MKKIVSIIALTALISVTLGAGPAAAWTVLTGEQMAENYRNGTPIAHNNGSDPIWGRTADQMAEDYKNGTPVRSIQRFGAGTPGYDTPLTDEEWARAYHGNNHTGSAK